MLTILRQFSSSAFELIVNLPHDPLNQIHRCGDLSQQIPRDADPFRIERLSTNGLSSPAIPIGCVALVALFPMEVSMHPRAILAFVLLSGCAGLRPIALGVPPSCGERQCESGWRLGPGVRDWRRSSMVMMRVLWRRTGC
jgi:hypothetical protein